MARFIYPNPTPDYLKIQGQELMQFTHYTISDLSGKTVLSGKSSQNPFGQSGIDRTALKRGLYLIKLTGNSINRVVKVVKD